MLWLGVAWRLGVQSCHCHVHVSMFPPRRLLEKSQRVEAILASMQATGAEAAQLHEVEEMITGPERQQLENLKRNVNK